MTANRPAIMNGPNVILNFVPDHGCELGFSVIDSVLGAVWEGNQAR